MKSLVLFHIAVLLFAQSTNAASIIDNLKKLATDNWNTLVDHSVAQLGNVVAHIKQTAGLDTNATFVDGSVDKFKHKVKLMYPGTLWCGNGDNSNTGDNLGTNVETDKCCRAHDQCPDNIPIGTEKHGLKNNGLFTRSDCSCEDAFLACLKKSNEVNSKAVGITYFSILRPQCFKKEAFVTACKKHELGKCIEYSFDKSKGESYQWFDVPNF